MSAFILGLDVYKESTCTTILEPDGEVIAQRRMPNEEVPSFLIPHPVENVSWRSISISPLYRRLTEGRA